MLRKRAWSVELMSRLEDSGSSLKEASVTQTPRRLAGLTRSWLPYLSRVLIAVPFTSLITLVVTYILLGKKTFPFTNLCS
jgi:hypothetical protein